MKIVVNISKIAVYNLVLFYFISVSQTVVFGAGEVDPTFNAFASREFSESNASGKLAVQPDGKIIIWGNFQFVNGAPKSGLVRLNQNGSLDNSFDCGGCSGVSVVVQPDGKILVSGSANNTAFINKLNADGSQDASFTSPFGSGATPGLLPYIWAIQADGKILYESRITGAFNRSSIGRLNSDGTVDETFAAIEFAGGRVQYQILTKVLSLPNGELLISGGGTAGQNTGFLFRYNSDGTRDTAFVSPTLNFSTEISDFDVQSDGSIVFAGKFTTVNSINRFSLAKLQPSGNIDSSFVPATVFAVGEAARKVKNFSDGRIITGTESGKFYRLNSNGSLDNTFSPPSNLAVNNWIMNAAGKILLFGKFVENEVGIYRYARLNADGTLDNSFNARVEKVGTISALALQANGKILVAGNFTRINGVLRNQIARLNADGTIDTGFSSGSGFSANGFISEIYQLIVQTDGKILVAGNFENYNGIARQAIARLNSDGNLDAGFNPVLPASSSVHVIAVQPDGKILIGGDFGSVSGVARQGAARLNTDGAVDSAFNALIADSGYVRSIAIQTDGEILIGGGFSVINGSSRNNLARLASNGNLNAAFNAGNITLIEQINVLPDNKYLVLTSSGINTIVKLNNDGAADTGFQAPTFSSNTGISFFVVQADGNIVIVGDFTDVNNNPRGRLARLRSTGNLDFSFFSDGADNKIHQVIQQTDGKLIVSGEFSKIAEVVRYGIARLISPPSPLPTTLFDFDGDGRADISVFRPSDATWYRLNSSNNNAFFERQFGLATDLPAPADYDGDGTTDLAVWRPSSGTWIVIKSSNNTTVTQQWGTSGDVLVPADYDADGQADFAVWRRSNGTWFVLKSGSGNALSAQQWGAAEDTPVAGDYDADGRADFAVWRPSNGTWFVIRSSDGGITSQQWGQSGDAPVPADYDADDKTDFVVFRPSTGFWHRLTKGSGQYVGVQFGQAGDRPVAADYDGDGKADVAVWRPENGTWYLNRSTQGFVSVQFGTNGDLPIEAAFVR